MKIKLTQNQIEELLEVLKVRFEKNMNRHEGLVWDDVLAKLKKHSDKLETLYLMEESGGEPDVTDYDKNTSEYIFMDCSEQSPKGRRSLCYDNDALKSRKMHKPKGSALEGAKDMGATLLDETQYKKLQDLGNFDTTTSSWILTPKDVRELGGAEFADFRFDKVYVYHNGAESYYASRGFRCFLRV